jgi:hypothetical protein
MHHCRLWNNVLVTQEQHSELSDTADRLTAKFDSVNSKVDGMREQVRSDPDTFGDKLIKLALPGLAGMLAGQVFKMIWNKQRGKDGLDDEERQEGFFMSLVFAALSAAVTAVVAQLSDRGSEAFVNHRHKKAAKR